MKTQNKKSVPGPKLSRKKIIRMVFVGIILLVVILQIIFDILLLRVLIDGDRGASITGLISTSVTNLTRPVVVGTDGRQYVPSERIVLPMVPNNSFALLYATVGNENGSVANELHLTTSTALQQRLNKLHNAQTAQMDLFKRPDLTAIFSTVPALQACSRGYTIRFNGDTSGYDVKVASVKLADGRTATIGREKLCSELNASTDAYIKQLASY